MIREIIAATPKSSPTADIQTMREGMESTTGNLPVPEGAQIAPLEVAGRPAEWISAKGVRQDRALLYLHGGDTSPGR